ncbi:MAG: transposase [Firmicutes bacterium]|nr:transposase [Bacillota bacterium]
MPQIARGQGISVESLRNWTRQAEIDAGEHGGPTTAEKEEPTRLRRENRRSAVTERNHKEAKRSVA